jgi:hypothetical protein
MGCSKWWSVRIPIYLRYHSIPCVPVSDSGTFSMNGSVFAFSYYSGDVSTTTLKRDVRAAYMEKEILAERCSTAKKV